MGIEPTHTILKTVVLPLNYTPLCGWGGGGLQKKNSRGIRLRDFNPLRLFVQKYYRLLISVKVCGVRSPLLSSSSVDLLLQLLRCFPSLAKIIFFTVPRSVVAPGKYWVFVPFFILHLGIPLMQRILAFEKKSQNYVLSNFII